MRKKPTDLKKVMNSIQVVEKNGMAMIEMDQPEKVYVNSENAQDAVLVSEYLLAAAHEADWINAQKQISKLKGGKDGDS